MSTVGPELPPHILAKRKRQAEEEDEARNNEGKEGVPDTQELSRSSSPDVAEKRRRVLGPSMPPAALDERPTSPPDDGDGDNSSSDDMGPALPPAPGQRVDYEKEAQRRILAEETASKERDSKPQRPEWMLAPPKQDDLSARADPTKLRNRKFNTGKGSKAPAQKSGADSALWTETPEQKRQRLEDEVMGVTKPATDVSSSAKSTQSRAEVEETARRIREYNDKNRNSSLYNEHKKAVPREKEDDPSARAFDKEKDIGGGQKIGHAKRKELLNKAADFGSKFAGGSYL